MLLLFHVLKVIYPPALALRYVYFPSTGLQVGNKVGHGFFYLTDEFSSSLLYSTEIKNGYIDITILSLDMIVVNRKI